MFSFNDLRDQQKAEDILLYTRMELVGELMAYRSQQKLSQRELANRSSVAQKTISRMESGKDLPKLDTLVLLADALGYDLSLSKRNKVVSINSKDKS